MGENLLVFNIRHTNKKYRRVERRKTVKNVQGHISRLHGDVGWIVGRADAVESFRQYFGGIEVVGVTNNWRTCNRV